MSQQMKRFSIWACLAAAALPLFVTQAQPTPADAGAPATAGPAPTLSPGAAEVVRLAEAGTREDVLVAYIGNSSTPFRLSADQILYLRDNGLTPPVISAMLARDTALQSQPQSSDYNQKLYPATRPPVPMVEPPPAPTPVPETVPPAQAPQPAPPPAPVYVSSPPTDVTYFYNDLSPYGAWVQLEGIGWCWQPRVVVLNRSWRPYCDGGYWAYTDAGWYWQSNYSWGWAPFHYGRWQLHERCGWVWMPDRVWGPAWVTWRSYGDHCGWAPLPPHAEFDVALGWRFNGVHVGVNFDFGLHPQNFTFVAMKDFSNHDLGHRRLAPVEVTRIYNHTTVINNYTVVNKTVVNHGIKVENVAAATHTPVHKVAIRDTGPGPAHSQTARPGETASVVYRKQPEPPARPVSMVAQKVDDRHPTIQHKDIVPTSGGARPGQARPNVPPTTTQPSGRSTTSKMEGNPVPKPTEHANPPSHDKGQLYPLRSGGQSQPNGTSQLPSNQTSHIYYPKSHHQAAETHTLPPLAPHSSLPLLPSANPPGEQPKPNKSDKQ
jgi:hypothetical protein